MYWYEKCPYRDGSLLWRSCFRGLNIILTCVFVNQVSGLARRTNYHGRWEMLIKKATDILNRLLVMAGKIPRNYIIDQVGKTPLLTFLQLARHALYSVKLEKLCRLLPSTN